MLRELRKAAPSLDGALPLSYDRIRDDAMHQLGIGTTRGMDSIVTGVFYPSWLSPQYTLGEKFDFWRGKINSARLLRNQMFATDLTRQVTRLELPVYFFEGQYDYTCSYILAKEYFSRLEAPLKGFYTFENSAHSPIFEEPERMSTILLSDVLTANIRLADPLP
jgi:pimeloyl-ACP methyl ester carboxylesterase